MTVTPLSIGDRELIGYVRKLNCHKYEYRTVKYRNNKNYNVDLINTELLNKDWHSVYKTNCPLKAWSKMKDFLTDTLNYHAPFIQKKVKGRTCLWLNETVKSQMNERDRLLRTARKTNKEIDWKNNKKKRKLVKNEPQRAKNIFYKNELREHSEKPSKFWETIKKIFPTKSKSPDLPKSFVIDDKLTNDKKVIANGFCQFFPL